MLLKILIMVTTSFIGIFKVKSLINGQINCYLLGVKASQHFIDFALFLDQFPSKKCKFSYFPVLSFFCDLIHQLRA